MGRPLVVALLVAALATAGFAQAPPCLAQNDGNAFNDNMYMGAKLVAWQFQVTSSLTVTAMETFTGEASGNGSIGIWTNASNNQPGASLGSGVWHMNFTNSWQGAMLGNSVTLTPGLTYWVVWGNPGGAQAAVDPPKSSPGPLYMGSFNGGASWEGPYQSNMHHWKVRFYCDGCAFEPYGVGCAGGSGTVPKLEGFGCPSPSATITVRIDGVVANATGILFVGLGNGTAPVVPGCSLQILPLTPLFVPAPVSGAGVIVYTGTLPSDTPVGDVYLQAFFPDASSPVGLSATNPLTMKVK